MKRLKSYLKKLTRKTTWILVVWRRELIIKWAGIQRRGIRGSSTLDIFLKNTMTERVMSQNSRKLFKKMSKFSFRNKSNTKLFCIIVCCIIKGKNRFFLASNLRKIFIWLIMSKRITRRFSSSRLIWFNCY